MNLIEKMCYKGTEIKFYDGVDFNILINHAKDGSEGFIFCFMDSWVKEVKSYNRNNKLKSVIENTVYSDFDWNDINNDFIAIYQADGIGIDLLYQTIRDKVIRGHLPDRPYIPIAGYDKGAWKIEVGKSDG